MQTMTLENLNYVIANQTHFYDCDRLHTPLLETGIPFGAITQICGVGKAEASVQIIKDNSELKAAWIESEFELNPLSVAPNDVDLTRFLCLEAGEHMISTCQQILKSNKYKIVILKSAPLDDFLLRKLQVAAEKSKTVLIILTENFSASWPISLMLKAHQNVFTEIISLEILRQR